MRTRTVLAAALTLGFALGCGAGDDPDFAAVIPDDRLQINMPVDDGATSRVGEYSEFYILTANVTRDVNGLVGLILGTAHGVAQLPPTWTDDTHTSATWGPYSGALDAVETQMWATQNDDGSIDWGFDQRPKNDDTAEWVPVIVGHVEEGATDLASRGEFDVDWTAQASIDPTQRTTGSMSVVYDIATDGVTGTVSLSDIAWNPGDEPNDAIYHYEQLTEGNGLMDLVIAGDMDGTASDLPETLYMRSRWEAQGDGRSDVEIADGDLADVVGHGSECWGEDFKTVYYTEDLTPYTEGDAAQCVFSDVAYNETQLP